MCGIGGVLDLAFQMIPNLGISLEAINKIQKHRGPDGEGIWKHNKDFLGFAHQRLTIIDLSTGHQPMLDTKTSNCITYNGEVYNYIELRNELKSDFDFRTTSDTEVVLNSYTKYGSECVKKLRGMFSFSIWDDKNDTLFCARDRFGIKPFYYTISNGKFYFSSEAKSLLPFMDKVEINLDGFKDYLTFQFYLEGKTLFKDIHELPPGHTLTIKNGNIKIERYWQVYYDLDFDHTEKYFLEKVNELLRESVDLHLRSDVPVGAYLSGGLDSSIIASVASQNNSENFLGFTGKFSLGDEFDESHYARELAKFKNFELLEVDIKSQDFVDSIRKVIYHLDSPVAGPGSFPQYMVSKLVKNHRKVVLGGQGGDEIFGGYTRYLVAYFEQCIKSAIDGTANSGNFIVTYESIIPNLTALKGYKPMLKQFWKNGLFDDIDKRYFSLVNRAPELGNEINWSALTDYEPYESFRKIFKAKNVQKESYFDSMTHFDFKTLLPALLQVEDRVSMAHGVESRVPFLDHPLIELAATIPSNIKFKDGTMKNVLKNSMKEFLPDVILNRKNKMGFPVPLNDWISGELNEFTREIFSSQKSLGRDLINNKIILENLEKEPKFGRKIWGLLCIELWHQEFIDKAHEFKKLVSY
ncbi:MAG: asparagine synthase (glutamine-hydrolyzing) [Cyanobacteriota bacterium]